jgi:hypothetical protein
MRSPDSVLSGSGTSRRNDLLPGPRLVLHGAGGDGTGMSLSMAREDVRFSQHIECPLPMLLRLWVRRARTARPGVHASARPSAVGRRITELSSMPILSTCSEPYCISIDFTGSTVRRLKAAIISVGLAVADVGNTAGPRTNRSICLSRVVCRSLQLHPSARALREGNESFLPQSGPSEHLLPNLSARFRRPLPEACITV